MDNLITNTFETFMPPRVDAAPKKSDSPPARQRQDISPGEETRPKRSERPAETANKSNTEDQVDSDSKRDKQDFNEVLAKKMSKKESKSDKKTVKAQDSEVKAVNSIPTGIQIAEIKIPEKIVNKETSPLINITKAKQHILDKGKPEIVGTVAKKSITQNLANDAAVKDSLASVNKITVDPKDTKTETAGIPVKTLVDQPKSNKAVVNLSQTTEKVQANTDKPEIPQRQTVQQGLKTLENNQNRPAVDKIVDKINDHTQLKNSSINTQPSDQKPVTVQSENVPQAGFQNKFAKSIENAKQQSASKTGEASSEINIGTDKKMVPNAAGYANKASEKNITTETASPANSDNITISGELDNKSVSPETSRFDIKPQPSNNIVNQVTEQIRASMTRGREQISIALDPPELGRIMIKFQQNNGEIVGIIEADKARTHREISEEMPVIVKSLNESGIQVKRVEVVLTGQDTQDALSDNAAKENNNTGRQGFNDSSDNQGNRGDAAGGRNYSRQYNPANNTDNHMNTVSDEAINMYA